MRLASGWTRPRPASNCGLRKGRDAFGGFAAGSIADSRPVEKRRSRVDEQVCSSTPLLMVRLPACSPYETSTNRRAGGLGPCLARGGRAACVRPPTCGDWCRFRAAGLGPGASSTCARPRGRGGPLGWRKLRASLVKNSVLRRLRNGCRGPPPTLRRQNPSSRLPPPRAERPFSVFNPSQNGISDHGRTPLNDGYGLSAEPRKPSGL